MRRSTVTAVLLLAFGIVLFGASDAQAIPAFARKLNLACSSCHSAVPYLNSTGRTFKELGYIMPDEDGEAVFEDQPGNKRISDNLAFDKIYPLSARIKGYVFDKKEGSDLKLRPIHELEVLSAGNFWKKGSYFIEFEGEDEADFSTELTGSFRWHQSKAFNIHTGFGSILHSDPYNSFQDGHRLTVAHKIPLDVGKAVDARFRKGAQFLNAYGRFDKFFYTVGFSAGNGNPEGENPKDYLLRGAYDFTPNAMLGAFYFDGQRNDGETDLARWGVDWNLDLSDFHVVGMYMNAEETLAGSPSESNDTGYLEIFYTHREGGRPVFVPLVRYGFTDLNDGADTLAAITAQAGFYVTENFKLAVEYYVETDQAPDKEKLDRVTLLADLAF